MKFYKQVELQAMFSIGSTYCTRICRAIDAHEDVYTSYSRIGTRYDICAFVHASKYLNELEAGEPVPEYNPEEITKVLMAHDYKEERAFAEHELKLDLTHRINEWFRVTQIPKNMKAEDFARIANKSILAIISE